MALRSTDWESVLVHLIFTSNCRPYLIFKVKMLSANFFRAFLLIEFANLLSKKRRWFKEEIIQPLPLIWDSNFWLLSKVIPSNFAFDSW